MSSSAHPRSNHQSLPPGAWWSCAGPHKTRPDRERWPWLQRSVWPGLLGHTSCGRQILPPCKFEESWASSTREEQPTRKPSTVSRRPQGSPFQLRLAEPLFCTRSPYGVLGKRNQSWMPTELRTPRWAESIQWVQSQSLAHPKRVLSQWLAHPKRF